MSYSDGARGSNWADLDKNLEIRRIDETGDVWILMWRDHTHSASGHNRAIKVIDGEYHGRVVRAPEYLRADEIFEVPNGWSYFIDSINDPHLHEVNYQEYQVGDLLVRDSDVLVIVDVYDDGISTSTRCLRKPLTWRISKISQLKAGKLFL